MELGSGIAMAGLCISGGAVVITVIRTFGKPSQKGQNGVNGVNGKNGKDACFPCKEHSGVMVCLESIEKGQDRHEEWMKSISSDIKILLTNKGLIK